MLEKIKRKIGSMLLCSGLQTTITNLALAGSYPRFNVCLSVGPKKEAFNLMSFYFKHFSIYFPSVIVTLEKL